MISDSPYELGEPVLSPLGGIVVGLLASIMMLLFVVAVEPLSGLSVADFLVFSRVFDLPAALVTHLAFGALLGLLYAASQQRIAAPGLIGVGIFYGFVLWVVGALLGGWLLGEQARGAVRSLPYLLACLLYGLILAAAAVGLQSQRARAPKPLLPKD